MEVEVNIYGHDYHTCPLTVPASSGAPATLRACLGATDAALLIGKNVVRAQIVATGARDVDFSGRYDATMTGSPTVLAAATDQVSEAIMIQNALDRIYIRGAGAADTATLVMYIIDTKP